MPSLCEQPKPPSRVYAKMREGDRERLSKLASGASGAVEGVAIAQTNFIPLPPRDPNGFTVCATRFDSAIRRIATLKMTAVGAFVENSRL